MVHSLEDLKSGKLLGLNRLKLACGLTAFPKEILTLADTLEILDLSDNQLTELPDSFSQLKKLKILFFARNNFTVFPHVLASCKALKIIGFKSNQIVLIPENAFPPLLQWLILTDNKILKLPNSIASSVLLQKCMLAGNQIEELPVEMSNCVNLELLRVSANKLKVIPKWLFKLPRVSWIAFAGNPATFPIKSTAKLSTFYWEDTKIKELLGEGASGVISKAIYLPNNKAIAVKVFKGAVTSDGWPKDEMKISMAVGPHKSLIQVLGELKDQDKNKNGLVMELISPEYFILGNPPSLESCTRDIFDENRIFNEGQMLKIVKSIAAVCKQLHSKGINHGDLYAHNILVDKNGNCLLGDFGAASSYDVNSALAKTIERTEVRAFGCLLEDVLNLIDANKLDTIARARWKEIILDCSLPVVKDRPSFSQLIEKLTQV